MTKGWTIYSLRVARELSNRGHKFIKCYTDKFNPTKNVYIYEYSEQLLKDIDEINSIYKAKRNKR